MTQMTQRLVISPYIEIVPCFCVHGDIRLLCHLCHCPFLLGDDMKMKTQTRTIWTVETVMARFEEAAKTAHSLPRAKVQGYFNVWQVILPGTEKPSSFADPKAIERMEESSRWIQWLDNPNDRNLIWLFVGGVRRKKIAETYGISKSTMERRVKYLLQQIVDRLNPE